MRHSTLLAAVAAIATLTPVAAHAQAATDDVIVMRRTVAPANVANAPSHLEGEWVVSAWQFDTAPAACDDAAPQSRTAVCKKNGATLPDRQCAEAKPNLTQTAGRYDGCVTDWHADPYSNWSSTCSTNASRTRNVQCQRSGAPSATVTRPEAECTKTKPDAQETGQTVTSSCTYSWEYSAWSPYSTTCGAATRTRTVTACKRSDGIAVTPQTLCTAAQDPLTENSNQTSGCPAYPGTWQAGNVYGEYGTCSGGKYSRSAPPVCIKNGGNAPDDQCDPATRPGPTVQENSCTQTCGLPADNGRAQYDAVHTKTLGTIPASTPFAEAAAQAKAMCDAYVSPQAYTNKGCQMGHYPATQPWTVEFRGWFGPEKLSFEGYGYFAHATCTGG